MMGELLEAKRLAARLRRTRLERGLSLRGAAAKIGVTKETLSDLERARRHPHPPTLAKIARGYDVEISDLLGPMVEEEPALLGKEGAPQEPGQPETAPPEEEWGPPVVHFARLSDNAYEELRGNARTLKEREDLRHRVDVEYEQLSRWVRELREEEVGAPSGDMEEARELLNRVRKRREVAFFDESESVIPFDEKRPPRPSRTAGKTVDEAYEAIQGNAKEDAASRPGEGSREQQPL